MEKLQSYLKVIFVMGVLFAFVTYTGCSDDDEGDNVASMLIGTWTITDSDIDAEVGGLSIKDYFIDIGGLSELEAETYANLFNSFLAAMFTGTLEIKDDNTYVSTFGGEVVDGTWSVNSTGDKIIIDGGTADEMIITIVSLTETTLVALTTTSEFVDIDSNPLSPEVEVLLEVQLTLSKN
jgi:hypothetical protein